jgi:hypothetical protein
VGRYDNPIRRTGRPGYIGWRFLGSLKNRNRNSIIGFFKPLQIRALYSTKFQDENVPENERIEEGIPSPVSSVEASGQATWVGGIDTLESIPGPIKRLQTPEPVFVELLRSPRIDSQPGGPVRQPYLTYRPARLHRLAESIPGLFKRLQHQIQDENVPKNKRIEEGIQFSPCHL